MKETLDVIEALLLGDETIPEKVSSRMILLGIQVNFRHNIAAMKCIAANTERIEAIERKQIEQDNNIENAKKESARYDKIIGAVALIGAAIGSIFNK